MNKIRIALATPSMIDRSRLSHILGQFAEFDIIAETVDLSATYLQVESLMPDVVLIAEVFTRTEEYTCMLSLFSAVETVPITINSGVVSDSYFGDANNTPRTLHSRLESFVLADIIKSAFAEKFNQNKKFGRVQSKNSARHYDDAKIVLIGASTGGIDALTTLLAHFPKNCPPTAIVQHTGQNFRETLARLLARRCDASVVIAETGVKMQAGQICLAGGLDGHLRLNINGPFSCNVVRGPAMSGHVPSIDELFLSAVPLGARVMAVLLTGMGRDGATGLLSLRRAGAATIGQNQQTSVVYGMPRVAHELGAVQQQLGIDEIGPAILEWAAAPLHYANIRRAAE